MKKHKYYSLFLILVVLSSCSLFKSSDELLPESTLVDVLVDIHMADGILAVKGYNIVRDSSKIELVYNDVMKKHNITQKQFDKTIKYYTKSPREFELVYEQVSEELSKIDSKFKESLKEAKQDEGK